MRRFTWYLKQLLPLAYWTRYTTASGEKRFSIWRMWFGRCFNVVDFPLCLGLQRECDRQTARALRKSLRRSSVN